MSPKSSASPALRAIAEHPRGSMPVRINDTGDPMDPDRPFRVLPANGLEQRVAAAGIEVYRDGVRVETWRRP